MRCPVCDVPLSISSREGVEIDFCPQCRGVWLDRGELDKVIERASASLAPTAPAAPAGPPPRAEERSRYEYEDRGRRYEGDRDRYDDRRYGGKDYDRKRKRRSFLDDLFDFD